MIVRVLRESCLARLSKNLYASPISTYKESYTVHGKEKQYGQGLDEVVDAGQRQKIAAWVDRQIQNYPRCDFVLTARPQGYRDALLSRAYVLEVMPFKADQVTRFIHNWYLATKLVAYNKDDQGVRQDAGREAEDLLSRLKKQPGSGLLKSFPMIKKYLLIYFPILPLLCLHNLCIINRYLSYCNH